MPSFLHSLAEGLRTREKFLEDHAKNPIFETSEGSKFQSEYEALVAEVQSFGNRVRALQESGNDYDEHFEREISNTNQQISVKIDSWFKKLPTEH